jgi:hypothetical protein
VTDDHQAPFTFTGRLEEVIFDVSSELIKDLEGEMRRVMAHQ